MSGSSETPVHGSGAGEIIAPALRLPCANCNHPADHHTPGAMRCLFGPKSYEPLELEAYRAWLCDRAPAHSMYGSLRTFTTDGGNLHTIEYKDETSPPIFTCIGPPHENFYKR